MDDLGTLVVLLGGWSVVLLAVVGWVSKLATERFLSKWRRDEQAQLAILKNQLADSRLIFQAAVGSHTAGQDAFQHKRLEAVGRLWPAVLALRDDLSSPVSFFGLLIPDEYDDAVRRNDSISALVADLDDAVITRAMQASKPIEQHRPYLGETLWLRFFIYRAFLGRLGFLIVNGKRNGHIEDWRRDSGIRQFLSAVLPQDEVTVVLESGPAVTAVNRAENLLESLILREMSLIASGQTSARESYENAKQMREALVSEKAGRV